MKVLFVCRQNTGRSQMAKAMYNALTGSNDADAAGVHVDDPGRTVLQRKQTTDSHNFFAIDVMNDIGLDISSATRQQLVPGMLPRYDKVISMAKPETSPQWLLDAPNYLYWDVKDPRGQDYETTTKARDEIKTKIERLLSS